MLEDLNVNELAMVERSAAYRRTRPFDSRVTSSGSLGPSSECANGASVHALKELHVQDPRGYAIEVSPLISSLFFSLSPFFPLRCNTHAIEERRSEGLRAYAMRERRVLCWVVHLLQAWFVCLYLSEFILSLIHYIVLPLSYCFVVTRILSLTKRVLGHKVGPTRNVTTSHFVFWAFGLI